ncbi:MAG: sulfoxide reductase heme-binding subunit YedZ [Immundisolibacterales bacterium]|nr:sulfoxide reductase heme-binding subunit YedZ [Immundisolibacterales bacterium]
MARAATVLRPGFGWLKAAVFLAALVPFGMIAAGAWSGDLGANPVETLIHHFGDWALRLLLATLAVTPLRRLTGWNQAVRLRRMLGLFAFFYASLHLATYFVLDRSLLLEEILDDLTERPYIMVGFAAFVLLVPLAATSTNAMIRRLGGRRWRALHRVVYVAAAGGVIHFWWLVKADVREPLIYAAVLVLLLALRLPSVVPFLRALPGRIRRRPAPG